MAIIASLLLIFLYYKRLKRLSPTSKVIYPQILKLGIKNGRSANLVVSAGDRFTRNLPQADFSRLIMVYWG